VPKFVDQVDVSPIESGAAGRIDVYRTFRRTIRSTLDDRVNSIFGWAVAVTAVLIQLQALASLRRQRLASPLRRLGGLRRSGGRLRVSPMLSASTEADLADIVFFCFKWRGEGCTDTAQLHASLPSRRFASTLRRLGGVRRPGGRLAGALMLSESAVVDLAVGGFLAHIAFCGQVGEGGFCISTAQN